MPRRIGNDPGFARRLPSRLLPLTFAACLGCSRLASAQTPVPPPTPVATPASVPGNPGLTRVDGALSAAALADYQAARSPQSAAVDLSAIGQVAASQRAPRLRGGRFEPINLPGAALARQAQPAAVRVQFDPARAGDRVWVQPVDGGTVDGQPGGRFIKIEPSGTLRFVFHAPVRSDDYQVVLRLDNVETILPFTVPDPAAVSAPTPSPAATPAPSPSATPAPTPAARG